MQVGRLELPDRRGGATEEALKTVVAELTAIRSTLHDIRREIRDLHYTLRYQR